MDCRTADGVVKAYRCKMEGCRDLLLKYIRGGVFERLWRARRVSMRGHAYQTRSGDCPNYNGFNLNTQPLKPINSNWPFAVQMCAIGAGEDYIDRQNEILDTYRELACSLCWDSGTQTFDQGCIDILQQSMNETTSANYDRYCEDFDECTESV